MQTQQGIQIPPQVREYLRLHHIVTLGTSSFTGMPHAATTAYVSDEVGLYFSMRPEEMTLRNIDSNHWASFTIDNYTPEFRKVRELRGVGRCEPVVDGREQATIVGLFAEKLTSLPGDTFTNIYRITPLVIDFVDFEYTAGVAVPQESSIIYHAAAEPVGGASEAISTQLEQRRFEPGQVIVRQGDRSERFFIIVEGEVEVHREGQGQAVIVTRHGPGQLFGEVGALTGAPQMATYVAVTPAVVMAIDRSAFQDVVSQSAGADLRQRVRDTMSEHERDARAASSAGSGPGTPPPGWYPDPARVADQRYWDGVAWTDHTR